MLRLTTTVILNTNKESILESSHSLYKLLEGLLLMDDFYSNPTFRKEGFKDVSLDLIIPESEAIDVIKNIILKFSIPDIKKYEKIVDVDSTFSSDFGYSILISYNLKTDREVSFTAKLGSSSVNGFGLLSNNGFVVDYKVSNNWITSLVRTNLVNYGIVKISDVKFLKQVKKYKYPLGLITYFSNDFEIPIPDDLKGIEYEFTDNGKYLSVVSRNNYREEDIEIYKKKLLNVMAQISQRVPEYVK